MSTGHSSIANPAAEPLTVDSEQPRPGEGEVSHIGTAPAVPATTIPEVGGRGGPEPTRFGDWEKNGRCVDF